MYVFMYLCIYVYFYVRICIYISYMQYAYIFMYICRWWDQCVRAHDVIIDLHNMNSKHVNLSFQVFPTLEA